MGNVIKGFREFITRGNVIDLAVAVVIGAAFTAVVAALTDNILNPVIAALGPSDAAGLGFQITDNPATFVDLGAVIAAAINFLLVAAIIYFVFVLPMNTYREKRAAGAEDEPAAPPDDVLLLQEIRDLLRAQQSLTAGSPPHAAGPGPTPEA